MLSLTSKHIFKIALIAISLLAFFLIWFRGGYATIYIDTDIGRDLSELSNLLDKKIVWLGPRLSAGFPASPIYYYTFLPALWLAGGDARMLILFNMVLAAAALVSLVACAWRRWGSKVLLPVWVTALSPWWDSTAIHPGNGYTYIFWLFGGLVTLYFGLPLFVTSLLLGTAIAHHPAAVLVLPILGYEIWRQREKLKLVVQLPLVILGLVLPWAPILAYEVITKGYLLRQFLANPENSYYFQLGWNNWLQVMEISGFSTLDWLALWMVAFLVASKRLKIWWGLVTMTLLVLSMVSSLPSHYLLGSVTLSWFVIVVSLVRHKVGLFILGFVLLMFLRTHLTVGEPPVAQRSIPSLEQTVDSVIGTQMLVPGEPISVVAVMSDKVEVPQADDYRFFLRRRGYTVLEVSQYGQAQKLIEFIEVPNFPWETWSSWETDQIGDKELLFNEVSNGTRIIIFQKL